LEKKILQNLEFFLGEFTLEKRKFSIFIFQKQFDPQKMTKELSTVGPVLDQFKLTLNGGL
jgi:hypothetical protein